jgi:hypothetical protein
VQQTQRTVLLQDLETLLTQPAVQPASLACVQIGLALLLIVYVNYLFKPLGPVELPIYKIE